jgi:Tol biopolymer transport system component
MAQDLAAPGKQHLANIKQLTSGGDNAEAYFSFDNKKIVFTSNRHDAQPGDTNVFIADRVNRISLHT